jgi:hypothetical protein
MENNQNGIKTYSGHWIDALRFFSQSKSQETKLPLHNITVVVANYSYLECSSFINTVPLWNF